MRMIGKGDTVFVYAITNDGEVIERNGVVVRRREGEATMLVAMSNGQKVTLSYRNGEIHNNMMWSRIAQKNLYIEKMLDILLERREVYQERIRATNKRITKIRECGISCNEW